MELKKLEIRTNSGIEVKCVFTDLLFTRNVLSRVERKSIFRASGSSSFLFLIHRRPACGAPLFLEGHLREDQQV